MLPVVSFEACLVRVGQEDRDRLVIAFDNDPFAA